MAARRREQIDMLRHSIERRSDFYRQSSYHFDRSFLIVQSSQSSAWILSAYEEFGLRRFVPYRLEPSELRRMHFIPVSHPRTYPW